MSTIITPTTDDLRRVIAQATASGGTVTTGVVPISYTGDRQIEGVTIVPTVGCASAWIGLSDGTRLALDGTSI